MQLFIITGASKGLGLGLLQYALAQSHHVISVSRSRIPIQHPERHLHISHDLSKYSGFERKLAKTLNRWGRKKWQKLHLINNAAVIEPVGPVSGLSSEATALHLDLNFKAPILLTQFFLKNFSKKPCFQTVTNISSGAALRPIPDWSLYCSSKAGLYMFTTCAAEDLRKKENIKFINYFPGVMDTEMQTTIRKQPKSRFAQVTDFIKLKEENKLLSAKKVAEVLGSLLENAENLNQVDYDVRSFLSE